MGEKTVIKRAKTAAARQLLNDEAEWYAETDRRGFGMRLAFGQDLDGAITLDRLSGGHPDEISPTADHLHAIMDTLASLHALDVAPVNRLAVREMYVDKPLARLAHIPKLAPDFAARETIEINGRTCPNPLARPYLLTDLLDRLMPPRFVFIHGDPTFSNIYRRTVAGLVSSIRAGDSAASSSTATRPTTGRSCGIRWSAATISSTASALC